MVIGVERSCDRRVARESSQQSQVAVGQRALRWLSTGDSKVAVSQSTEGSKVVVSQRALMWTLVRGL